MANAWIEHIRKFARDNNMTYACALTDPQCKASYKRPLKPKEERNLMAAEEVTGAVNKKLAHKEKKTTLKAKMGKKAVLSELKTSKEAAQMGLEDFPAPAPPSRTPATNENISMTIEEKKKRGRPAKYATKEEAKKAKTEKSIASNKRRAAAKKATKKKAEDMEKEEKQLEKNREGMEAEDINRAKKPDYPNWFNQHIIYSNYDLEEYPKLKREINLKPDDSTTRYYEKLYKLYLAKGVPEDEIKYVIRNEHWGKKNIYSITKKQILQKYGDIPSFIRVAVRSGLEDKKWRFKGLTAKKLDNIRLDTINNVEKNYSKNGFFDIMINKSGWGQLFPPDDFFNRYWNKLELDPRGEEGSGLKGGSGRPSDDYEDELADLMERSGLEDEQERGFRSIAPLPMVQDAPAPQPPARVVVPAPQNANKITGKKRKVEDAYGKGIVFGKPKKGKAKVVNVVSLEDEIRRRKREAQPLIKEYKVITDKINSLFDKDITQEDINAVKNRIHEYIERAKPVSDWAKEHKKDIIRVLDTTDFNTMSMLEHNMVYFLNNEIKGLEQELEGKGLKGKGVYPKMSVEDMGGLTHIYPLHHNIIMNMLREV